MEEKTCILIFFTIKNYLKIFRNKKSKKRLCYVLDHPVICRMAFVSMFWDENWSPICMLPLGAPNPPFWGGLVNIGLTKKTHEPIHFLIERSTIVILFIIA